MFAFVVHRVGQAESSSHLKGEVGRKRRTKDEAASMIDQILLECAASANKGSRTGQCFATCVHNGQGLLCQSECGHQPLSVRAAYTDRMGFVHDDLGAMLSSKLK